MHQNDESWDLIEEFLKSHANFCRCIMESGGEYAEDNRKALVKYEKSLQVVKDARAVEQTPKYRGREFI